MRSLFLAVLVSASPWLGSCASVCCPDRCFEESGIRVQRVPVTKHPFAALGPADGSSSRERGPWIFELQPVTAGGLLLPLGDGAAWLDSSGSVERRIRFETGKGYFPVQVLGEQANGRRPGPSFLAVPWKGGDAVLAFDAAGRLLWRREADLTAWAWLVPGDIEGDGVPEVLVGAHGGPGVHVFDLQGERKALVRTEHYLTAYHAADIDLDGDDEMILYGWPDEDRRGTFEVFDVEWQDAEVHWKVYRVARWKAGAVRDFTVAPAPTGDQGIVTIDGESILWTSFDGREIGRLAAPDASCFRYVFTAALSGGRRIVVLDGSGYTAGHAVYVYESDGELLYHEIADGHVRALHVPAGDPAQILLAGRGEVWSYRVGDGSPVSGEEAVAAANP